MSEDIIKNYDVNEVTNGVAVVHVRNLDLAVCLLSVGVSLRKDPPYTHLKLASGEDQWTFNFEAQDRDGQFNTMDLVEGFKQDMKFVEDNPVHPFTFAMCALKNLESFKAHMLRDVPFVAFKGTRQNAKAVVYVKAGSKKYVNCIKKGMRQL